MRDLSSAQRTPRRVTEFRRKLIEVALPLEAINIESAREKSIRQGHPSTLHLWWARRPLAACRAVLFASLVDDPSANPDQFPTDAMQEAERKRLFTIIEQLVKWENSDNERVLNAARAEIVRSCGGNVPAVLDPFCGGGSIPLEAQRLGLKAFAGDLNPVAVLITKALTEIPPKFAGRPPVNPAAQSPGLGGWTRARGLADDVRFYGQWMREESKRRVGHLYPNVKLPAEFGGGEATIIAWIWARTVKSPNPAWDAPMPLVRSFKLSTKTGQESWIEPIIDREAKRIRYTIRRGVGPTKGTVGRNGAICLATGTAVPLEYIRNEGKAGRIGTQLIAMVAEGPRGRIFLPPDEDHERIAASANPSADVADTNLPLQALGFRVQAYGMTRHRDLFTRRQLETLEVLSNLVGEAHGRVYADSHDADYADAVAVYLALGVSRLADIQNSLCMWETSKTQTRHLFTRQTVSMLWDFAENNAFSGAAGDYAVSLESLIRVVERLPDGPAGVVKQGDAGALAGITALVSTDPPYYDNVGYADLSDFFYVWLRRSLKDIYPSDFATLLVPKAHELVANPHRFGGDRSKADDEFERGLSEAFGRMRECHQSDFPLSIVYGFKQSEDESGDGKFASTGWETMLEALMHAGLSINGTWPLRSELANRMRGQNSNALASSIVLVCRPRPESASLATRKDFVAALQAELPEALRRLQQGSIAPVDLAQAAIGPGMAVFSRFARVIEADGSGMPIRAALAIINGVLDETLAEQEADFDADTRWAVAWFDQFGMNPGDFGVAETLSKAKNSAVNALVEAGIVEARAGKVRLLDRAELHADWNPADDRRLTVWEVTQHLIGALETGGESAAADLVGRVGGLAETARELAYRLYNICERKRWAKEALSYNGLVVAWPAILRIAVERPSQAVQLSLGS
jgi:putative DNA methylase